MTELAWTRVRHGEQHVKGDGTTWVCRCGTAGWIASARGLRPDPNAIYPTSAAARVAVEEYMAAGAHRLPYNERLAHREAAA